MVIRLTAIPLIVLVLQTAAAAQSQQPVSTGQIVEALQGEKPQATRSLTGRASQPAALSAQDHGYLKGLASRGLRIETVARAGEILDASRPPSLDIEIAFEFDSSRISPASADALEALGNALKNPSLSQTTILLNGHTDAKGADTYNLALSQKRAEEVRNRLIADHGISAERLVAIGFGEERPKDPSNPESGINRRVEVVNIGKQP